jgi:hypothetical protein
VIKFYSDVLDGSEALKTHLSAHIAYVSVSKAAKPTAIRENDTVLYRSTNGDAVQQAVVVKVHADDEAPYYTISINGTEKQTDAKHLEKVS